MALYRVVCETLNVEKVVILKSGSKVKDIGTDTYRSAAYDFLLMFHSDPGLSRTISKIVGDFSRKSQNFPIPCIFRPRWRGYPWNWVSVQLARGQKIEWWVTRWSTKFEDRFSRL